MMTNKTSLHKSRHSKLSASNDKMRNCNPFTQRQINLIVAINERISQIDDPDPEIITDESYHWRIEQTKQFGKIPKITFYPHSCRIKAEILKNADLIDENREQAVALAREQYGIKKPPYSQARLFEAELNNIMFKIKKAVYVVGYINHLFAAGTAPLAEPLTLLQQIVLEEQGLNFIDEKQN